jgi:hypothetical protein
MNMLPDQPSPNDVNDWKRYFQAKADIAALIIV